MKQQRWYLQETESFLEISTRIFIKIAGLTAVGAVGAITFYLFWKGIPFFLKEGVGKMILETKWKPLNETPEYGIFYMIGTTCLGSIGAMTLAMPIGVFTAVFLTKLSPKWVANIAEPAIEILAGIPSIIYGMIGLIVITPFLSKIEMIWYQKTGGFHMPSGGANLIAAILVLAAMVLPTIIIMSKTAIKAVPKEMENGAKALGATKLEVIFGVTLKSAGSGIFTAGLLGFGRVMGETMAVSFVAGGTVNFPLPFSSVRFLTTALVSEMGYAKGVHREALFAIGFILYLCIMVLMIGVHKTKHKGKG